MISPKESYSVGLGIGLGFPGCAVVKNSASAKDTRDMGLIPELGKSFGVENGNPL